MEDLELKDDNKLKQTIQRIRIFLFPQTGSLIYLYNANDTRH